MLSALLIASASTLLESRHFVGFLQIGADHPIFAMPLMLLLLKSHVLFITFFRFGLDGLVIQIQ